MNRPHDWPVRLIQLLAVPGLLLAYYLLLFHNGVLLVVCEGGPWDCSQVSGPDAPYASIGPVPVALIGLAGYAGIFLLTWLPAWWPALEEWLPELLVGVTGLAFAFTLVLTALEALVIHAFCLYCVYSAGIITVMFGLALLHLRRRNQAG